MKSEILVLGSTRGGLFWFTSTRSENGGRNVLVMGLFCETKMKDRCGNNNKETMRKRSVGER